MNLGAKAIIEEWKLSIVKKSAGATNCVSGSVNWHWQWTTEECSYGGNRQRCE